MTIAKIEKMYGDNDDYTRREAVTLCKDRDDVPLSLIERFFEDEEWCVRLEAVKLCQGRDDVLKSLVNRMLNDEDEEVHSLAREIFAK